MDKQAIEKILRGRKVLVTGGTGSFGNQIVQSLLEYRPGKIRVYSRDEKKQYDMLQQFATHENIEFVLGDVRDLERTREACREIDVVFHAAAMKQVPNSEIAPYEAVKTNVCGAENVRRAAIENGVQTVIAISTDKAVKPVNVMGMTKSLQERIMLGSPNEQSQTKFVCVRYGNVIGSRGSVVPLFRKQALQGEPLTITHPDMTRFLLTLLEAVDLVMWATVQGKDGDLWVRKMPAANVVDLAKTIAYGMTGQKDYPHQIVGIRAGEKLHEVLVSEEEMWRAVEYDHHFLIPSWSTENRQRSDSKATTASEYASNSYPLLDRDGLFNILSRDGWLEKCENQLRVFSDAA